MYHNESTHKHMRSIYDLLEYRPLEQWVSIIGRAVRIAEEKPEAGWLYFQNELQLGAEEAFAYSRLAHRAVPRQAAPDDTLDTDAAACMC